MQRLRVGFLSEQNYLDRNAWSGIIYYMYRALKQRDIQIIYLGESSNYFHWQKLSSKLGKKKSSSKIGSTHYINECTKFASKVQKQLNKTAYDVIFAPVASKELFFVETSIPIIYLSDTTFNLYHKYYQIRCDEQEIECLEKQESIAISKASKLVYPSAWAANSAISDYHAEANKIEIIPFGANLDNTPSKKELLLSRQSSVCYLLFVGKDWYRKGGEIAFETLISLRKMGIDAELVVVGCVPPPDIKHDKMTVIPYLNKNIPQQREQLNKLFLRSHFFIFPTRADCSPIVTCEANAFGLPVITTEVGGIPTIIKNGINGYMLPLTATGDDYANLIGKIVSDRTSYDRLMHGSREEYDMRLNWNKWAENFHHAIASMLD